MNPLETLNILFSRLETQSNSVHNVTVKRVTVSPSTHLYLRGFASFLTNLTPLPDAKFKLWGASFEVIEGMRDGEIIAWSNTNKCAYADIVLPELAL